MPQLRSCWLKPKLAAKPWVVGTFLTIPAPAMVELLGLAGFDFFIADGEHGAITPAQMEDLIRAAATTGISPMVRAPQFDPVAVRLPLDLGAAGVHVPQVESAAAAARAARYARFYPEGERGLQPYVRAASFRACPTEDFLAESNRQVMVVPHLEGLGGLQDLTAMVTTPGVDVCFFGPYDLSQALGIPGQVTDPRIDAAITAAVAACGPGTVIGAYADSPQAAARRIRQGVRYVALSLDTAMVLREATSVRHQLDDLLKL